MNLEPEAKNRLEVYLNDIGEILKYPKRKAAFATYVLGLFSSVRRKTAEGLAALAVPDPERTDAEHQRLLHVIGQSKWSDRDIRRHAANHALDAISCNEQIESWIIDDTGWVKKGKHSVGVQRQYTGTSGKVDNCQLGVSLVAASTHWQVPLDFALYLPQSWAEDINRRQQAKVPDDLEFTTKQDLATAMICHAVEDKLPRPRIVLADSFYGRSGPFRAAIRKHRLHYGVGVRSDLKIRRIDDNGIRRGPATTAAAVAKKMKYRRITWSNASAGKLSSHFAFARVTPVGDLNDDINAEEVWLVIEKTNESQPYKFSLCSLPKTTTRLEIIRLIYQRWKTERVYQDMKQEFGLAQYQGRSYIGWHHHVSAAMVCHAFAVAEQARLFPPRPGNITSANTTNKGTASTPLRRVYSDDTPTDSLTNTSLALALPLLPTTDVQTGKICLCKNVTQ